MESAFPMRESLVFDGTGVEPGPEQRTETGNTQEGADNGPPETQIRITQRSILGRSHVREARKGRVKPADDDTDDSFHRVIYRSA